MQQGDVGLREGAGTLYRPAAGLMRKEMPWPLTAGVLIALLLQFPRQLTVAATLQQSPNPEAGAKGALARNPQEPQTPRTGEEQPRREMAVAAAIANPLLPLSHLLEAVERSD